MRLFIALLLPDEAKDELCRRIGRLREAGAAGSFTRRENLHLTVAFIGETDRAEEVKGAMDRVDVPAFSFEIGGLGRFERREGDVLWAGVREDGGLSRAQHRLAEELTRSGFVLEKRPFRPHLTLCRRVRRGSGPESGRSWGTSICVRVEKLSLMKSERIGGSLIYTEIYEKRL